MNSQSPNPSIQNPSIPASGIPESQHPESQHPSIPQSQHPSIPQSQHPLRHAAALLAFAVLYYVGAEFSLRLSIKPANVAPFWVPNAFLLLALTRTPPKNWWRWLLAIVPGMVAIGYRLNIHWAREAGFITANWAEVVFAGILLHGTRKRRAFPEGPRDALWFICVAAMAGCMGGGLGAVVSVIGVDAAAFMPAWRTWWLGDSLGLLIMGAPLIMVRDFAWRNRRAQNPRHWIEFGLLMVFLNMLAGALFVVDVPHGPVDPSLLYLLLIPLVWAGLRHPPPLAGAAVVTLALIATIGTAMDVGPFGAYAAAYNMLQLQGFLAVSAMMTLLLSTMALQNRVALRKYETLFASFPLGITVSDSEGSIVEANPTSEALLGIGLDEHLQRRIDGEQWRIVREDGSPMPANEYPSVRALKEDRIVGNVPMGIVKGEDDTTWINVTAAPLPLEGYGVVVTYSDVTAELEAEREQKQLHELIRYVIEHTNSAVAVHDRDLRYLYVSQSYLDQYHVADTNIIGKHHYEVFPDLPQKWRDVHQRALAGETASADRDPYYRADGSVEWTRWECRPWYDADGEVGGIIVYTAVITDKVQAEEAAVTNQRQLAQAEKFAAIGRVSSGIAHEINNPLAAVRSSAELLKRDLTAGGAEADSMAARVEKILRNTDRCKGIVEGLLGYAQRGVGAYRSVDLMQSLRDALVTLKETQGANGPPVFCTSQSITLEDVETWHHERPTPDALPPIATHAPSHVRARPGQLEQIFRNLLANAVAATEATGCVVVTCRKVDAGVEVAVADTGEGVPEEHRPLLFEPFFTTREPGEGTGLGLYMARRIVEGGGGRIDCESKEGIGTIMRCWLPAGEHDGGTHG